MIGWEFVENIHYIFLYSNIGVFYQLLNSNPMVPTPPVLGATFSPYCPCNSALWQIVWMQQREITNFGRAVCSVSFKYV